MFGAIIGDLAGSIYEFDQTKHITPVRIDSIIEGNAFYSDDTILTIAIADAIVNGKDYEECLRQYIKEYIDYKPNFKPYFKTSFSPGIIGWAEHKREGNSKGNGAMMRISPVGYLFNSESDVKREAEKATVPSHNSEESIKSATTIALIIFYLRQGYTKEEVYQVLNIKPKEKMFTRFNSRCSDTIDNCLYAFYNSTSFEDSIKRVIQYGGDTDTNACIVGSMAEALYGVPDYLKEEAEKRIPQEFQKVLKKVYK